MSPMIRLPLTTELALLGFLNERPMYGYEILQCMADPGGLGHVWHVKQSQFYAFLGKLEDEGFIYSELQLQENRPPRKIFHLTPAGTQVFLDWVHSPVEHSRDMRLDFLVKLYFIRKEGNAALQQLIQKQRVVCLEWMKYQEDHDLLAQNPPDYEWFVCQFRTNQIQANLNWLDQCQQILEKDHISWKNRIELIH
jgi:PadR family transcriptional regulator, regulatory protein AphA